MSSPPCDLADADRPDPSEDEGPGHPPAVLDALNRLEQTLRATRELLDEHLQHLEADDDML